VALHFRFRAPACQVQIVRLPEDLVPALFAVARRERLPGTLRWSGAAAVCVNLVSRGYPGTYTTGLPISGVDEAEGDGVHVFHAGTVLHDGRVVTAGGRVLSVTATAPSLDEAISRAYGAVERIHFDGMHFRRDIGTRARPLEPANRG